MSPKNFRKISYPELEISQYLCNFSKKVTQLTDIQEICNYLELVYKHPRNVSKRFQKDSSSRTKDIKQFSQLLTHTQTDRQTDTRTSVNLELTPPEVGQLKNVLR